MKLKDCLSSIIDNRGKNPNYLTNGDYPVIDNIHIKNMLYPNLNSINRYINKKTYNNFLRGYVHMNMPIMTLVGNGIGNVTLAPTEKCVIVQNTIGFNTKKELLNEIYLYYWFKFKSHELRTFNRGTGQPSIKKTDIENMEITIPDIEIQNKIVDILFCIDKKIELNNQINDNLFEQAITIFKDGFPKVEQGNEIIGNYLIPKKGKNLVSRDTIKGNVPVIAGGLEPATYHNSSNTKSPVITISASGANAGFVNLWNIPVWSSDSSFIDYSITENVYFWYVALKLRQEEIYDSQTGSAQPHIYPKHIAELQINSLEKDRVNKYTKIVTPLFEMIGKNKEENKHLEQLRDTLLPKLMNGEINLDKIEI